MTAEKNDPAKLLADMLRPGANTMRPFMEGESVDSRGTAAPMEGMMAASRQMASLHQQYLKQIADFWAPMAGLAAPQNVATAPAKDDDRRFAAQAWRDDPRFDVVKRTYLGYSDFLQSAVDSSPLDEKAKGQLRHSMRQFIDAMSPSNFLWTNPEAIQLAVESGGQSVTDGMRLFFDDLAKGRVTNTDESAFEIGRNVATTPGAVIYENELIQLIQYAPSKAQVRERPLVIVPPCINKYYILDLQPQNSFVRYAIERGHTVFMTSWRNATEEIGTLTWDDYLEQGVMRAIDIARTVTGADKVNALGFCVGGTL